MADRRGIIVPLVILAFIFLSPEPARPPRSQFDPRPTLNDVIAEEQRSLGELQNSTYEDLRFTKIHNAEQALNLTGLEPDRGYSWDPLSLVQGKAQRWLGYAVGDWGGEALELEVDDAPLYKNVTGYVHGQWVRSKLDTEVVLAPPNVNLSDYAPEGPFGKLQPREFGRNITGEGGDLRLRFREKDTPIGGQGDLDPVNATNIEVEMTISDTDTSEEHDLRLFGAYFPSIGEAMLTTTSDKYAGIFILPHLAPSRRMFEASRSALNSSITRAIARQVDRETERLNPWGPTLDGAAESPFSTPRCEMVVYLQQLAPLLPEVVSRSAVLSFLERELRFPTGAFLPSAPELRFAMSAFSPDCGFVIESKGPPDYVPQDGNHLMGPKVEVLHKSSRHHLLLFTFVLALQLALLMRQMREASTPSTRSRISFYTIAMLALGDGFTTMTFLLISLFIGGLWINLVGTAFLAFISVSFFGMRFLMDIWTVQAPERARAAREEAEEDQRREQRFQAALQRLRDERQARLEAASGDTPTTGATESGDITSTQQTTVEQTTTTRLTLPNPSGYTLDSTPPVPSTGDRTTAISNTMPNPSGYTMDGSQPALAPPQPPPPPPQPQPPPGSLPLPVTAQRPTDTGATPVFMPSDQEGLEPAAQPNATTQTGTMVIQDGPSFGSLYTRFYLILLATLFFSLNAASWPAGARRVYFTTLALLYLSFWLPQLKRNVQRNCRHALNWEYVIGQSVLRLLPFAYFYGYEHNVLFAEVDYISLAILVTWVWLQVVLLVSQEIVGPRWFVGKDWAPPAYDYHPVLREDEEGATMPIGFSQATGAAVSEPTSPIMDRTSGEGGRRPSASLKRRDSTIAEETREKGKRVFDCAICMQDLEVSVIEDGASADSALTGPAGLLARRVYMVTPCRHIFHSACLEGWMKYRLQCPICRETLPPL